MKQRIKNQLLDTSPLFYTCSKSRNIQSWRDAERSCWQGAAAQLLSSSGAQGRSSQMKDHAALGLGDGVLPCHHGWGHCSGSGAIVWTHDTCTNPLFLSLVERPSLAAQLPQAVPSTKGGLVPLSPPRSPKILPTVWISHSAVSAAPFLSDPSTPLLWPLPNCDYTEWSSTCRTPGHSPKPPGQRKGKINDHK